MTLQSRHAPPIGRRAALLGLAACWSSSRCRLAFASAPTEQRLVVVILRGALDGLAAVVPYGDPNLTASRPGLIPGAVGSLGGMADLGGFYGLHPALAALHPLYADGTLLAIHAVAGHYRSRSHFEAQDLLESGADHRMTSGWLNRLTLVLDRRDPAAPGTDRALSVGLSMPLLLRGPAPVGSWAPSAGARPSPDLYARIAALNATDRLTGPAIRDALRSRFLTTAILSGAAAFAPTKPGSYADLAHVTGTLLGAPTGPRIAALELGGWDTHSAQTGRLAQPLTDLAAGLLALKAGLGDAWSRTTVLVMTEFGRTVRANGTAGTDHGTGTVAFVLGGQVAGGRVAGSWPGLTPANLLDNRDLQPTTDLRSVAKSLLIAQWALTPRELATVFPDSAASPALRGVMRASG